MQALFTFMYTTLEISELRDRDTMFLEKGYVGINKGSKCRSTPELNWIHWFLTSDCAVILSNVLEYCFNLIVLFV